MSRRSLHAVNRGGCGHHEVHRFRVEAAERDDAFERAVDRERPGAGRGEPGHVALHHREIRLAAADEEGILDRALRLDADDVDLAAALRDRAEDGVDHARVLAVDRSGGESQQLLRARAPAIDRAQGAVDFLGDDLVGLGVDSRRTNVDLRRQLVEVAFGARGWCGVAGVDRHARSPVRQAPLRPTRRPSARKCRCRTPAEGRRAGFPSPLRRTRRARWRRAPEQGSPGSGPPSP